MSVNVSSAFVLSYAGSGLATGLIIRPRSPKYHINSDGEDRPEVLIRKVEEEEDCCYYYYYYYYYYYHHHHHHYFTLIFRRL
jgi:hypothetical protein